MKQWMTAYGGMEGEQKEEMEFLAKREESGERIAWEADDKAITLLLHLLLH